MMLNWFVAYVRSCQERNVVHSLEQLGVENYLPIRKEKRRLSDRTVLRDRILLPGLVFIRCEEQVRRSLFTQTPYIVAFMTDRVHHRPVVIPDVQMDNFISVVSGSPNDVILKSSEEFSPGEKVKIVSGPFKNIECEVVKINNSSYVCIRLGLLGSAVTEINASLLEKL